MRAVRPSSDEELKRSFELLADVARSMSGFRGTTLYQDLDSELLHCVTFWATEESARTYNVVLNERKDVLQRLFHAESDEIAVMRTVAHHSADPSGPVKSAAPPV